MGKRKKQRGHFCWCCGAIKPNEQFSGGGHARHLCRKCARLGADELAFRRAAHDIDRLVGSRGAIRRKQREIFERFLSHPSPRVRAYAAEVATRDAQVRDAFRQDDELEDTFDPDAFEDDMFEDDTFDDDDIFEADAPEHDAPELSDFEPDAFHSDMFENDVLECMFEDEGDMLETDLFGTEIFKPPAKKTRKKSKARSKVSNR